MTRMATYAKSLFLAFVFAVFALEIYGQCGNISFENGSFSGWRGQVGCVTDQIDIDTACNEAYPGIDPNGGSNSFQGQHAILTPNFNGGSDPFVPMIKMRSPLKDNYIARIGDYRASTALEYFARGAYIEYKYPVTELNALVTLYFAIVLQDPSDHAYGERPFFNIDLLDPDGKSVDCINYVVAAQQGVDGFEKYQDYFYRNWTPVSINLEKYAGKTVTLKVMTSDCGQEAHLGYAYLDVACTAPEIKSKKTVICPNETLDLVAPPGMKSYKWRKASTGMVVHGNDDTLNISSPDIYTCEMVPFSTSNSTCPFTLTIDISPPRGTIDPQMTAEPNPVCLNEELTLSNVSTVDGTTVNYLEWRQNGSFLNANSNPYKTFPNQTGFHDYVLELIDADQCTFYDSVRVEVKAPPEPKITEPPVLCSDDPVYQLDFSPSGGVWQGVGVNQSGQFNPAQAGFQGSPHQITYTITDVCSRSSTVSVQVKERRNPTINPAGPFCTDDSPFQLTAAQNGGIWTGIGTNSQGIFDPAQAGEGIHTIRYQFTGACPSSDELKIEVIRRKDPSITNPGTFCLNDPPRQLESKEPGGKWTGPGVSQTGIFNPAAAGAGEHNIVYSFGGPCPADRIIRIKVIRKANADFSMPAEICQNEPSITLVPVSFTGTFSGPGIEPANKFNPAKAGPGTHDIKYMIGGNCGDTVVKQITVNPWFDATIDPIPFVCSNQSAFDIEAASDGGVWKGTGITNASNGTFNPAIAGVGVHQITYNFSGKCPSGDTLQLEVKRKKNADFSLPSKACSRDEPLNLNPLESGGIWSGPGVDKGIFYPDQAGVGKHTIIHLIPGDCGDTKSKTIEVFAQPDATILGPLTACILEDPIAIRVRQAGGTWSGPGVDQNGIFDPKIPGEGIHQIRHSFGGNCPAADTLNIKVTSKLDASITPVPYQCNDNPAFNLEAVDPGGRWSGTGISNQQTGRFSPNIAGKGVHTVTYLIGGLCGDTATLDIQVEQRADASILSSKKNYCFSAANDTLKAMPGGYWLGPATDSAGVFAVSNLNPGNYKIYHLVDSLCPDQDSISVTVLEPVSLSQNQLTDPSCHDKCDGEIQVNAQGGLSGGYSFVLEQKSSPTGRFTNLCEGTYKIGISDAAGCRFDSTLSLIAPDSLYALHSVVDEKCYKQNGGAGISSFFGGTAPYQVSWSNGASGDTNLNYASGAHYYTVSDAQGCLFTDSFQVGFIEGPKIFGGSDSVSCYGESDGRVYIDSITNGIAPYRILWSTGDVTTEVTQLAAGTYPLEVRDEEECLSLDTFIVHQPNAIVLNNPSETTFCDGQDFTFIPQASEGNGGPFSFNFYTLGLQQNQLYSDSSLNVSYYASDRKGCLSDTASFSFIELDPLELEIEQDTFVCPNSKILFGTSATGGLSADYQFTWNDGFKGAQRQVQFSNSGNDTLLWVTLDDACSTPTTDTVYISFYEPSIAGFSLDPDPARGCEPLEVHIIDESVNSIQQFYQINGADVNGVQHKLYSGTYSVLQHVVSAEGCRDTLMQENIIEVYPIPRFDLIINPGDPTELSEFLDFSYQSNLALQQFSWVLSNDSNGDTLMLSPEQYASYNPPYKPGFYRISLEARSVFGCYNSKHRVFEITEETRVYIPTAFSPNGDGDNDVFAVVGANIQREKAHLQIFDRWGQLIFESHDPVNEPWDGLHQETNSPLPPGLYVWKLDISDPIERNKRFTGELMLLR